MCASVSEVRTELLSAQGKVGVGATGLDGVSTKERRGSVGWAERGEGKTDLLPGVRVQTSACRPRGLYEGNCPKRLSGKTVSKNQTSSRVGMDAVSRVLRRGCVDADGFQYRLK